MHRRAVLQGAAVAAGLALASPGAAWPQNVEPGRWLRLESPNFILYSTLNETRSREEIVALERFQALLSKLMPRQERSPLKLTVYLAGTTRDFEMAAPDMGREVGGFYAADVEEVHAFAATTRAIEKQRDMPKNVRALDARTILFHEIVHHFQRANSRVIYPPWYREGFAEFMSTADFFETGVYVGKFTANRAIWLTAGDWLGIKTFLGRNPSEMSRDDRAQFYAQSWLATHFLFNRPDQTKAFDGYVNALQSGADPVAAFEPAFGVTPEAFDKQLREYKRKSVQFVMLNEPAPDLSASVHVERLGSAADNLVMLVAHLRRMPPQKEARRSVETIRNELRKNPADPYAMRASALAEIWYGDLAVARKALDAMLAPNANSPETQHLSGLCDLRAAYAAKDKALAIRARSAFAAAHRLDGTRACSLFRYAECGLMAQGSFDTHLVDVLVTAYRLAPQVDVLALVTAQALLQHKRFDEAIFVLRPLVADMHADALSALAGTYMTAAKAGQQTEFRLFGSARSTEPDWEEKE